MSWIDKLYRKQQSTASPVGNPTIQKALATPKPETNILASAPGIPSFLGNVSTAAYSTALPEAKAPNIYNDAYNFVKSVVGETAGSADRVLTDLSKDLEVFPGPNPDRKAGLMDYINVATMGPDASDALRIAATVPVGRGFNVLHASKVPHSGFDLKYYKTGEGAAVYGGPGFYFTESPGVAQWYLKNFKRHLEEDVNVEGLYSANGRKLEFPDFKRPYFDDLSRFPLPLGSPIRRFIEESLDLKYYMEDVLPSIKKPPLDLRAELADHYASLHRTGQDLKRFLAQVKETDLANLPRSQGIKDIMGNLDQGGGLKHEMSDEVIAHLWDKRVGTPYERDVLNSSDNVAISLRGANFLNRADNVIAEVLNSHSPLRNYVERQFTFDPITGRLEGLQMERMLRSSLPVDMAKQLIPANHAELRRAMKAAGLDKEAEFLEDYISSKVHRFMETEYNNALAPDMDIFVDETLKPYREILGTKEFAGLPETWGPALFETEVLLRKDKDFLDWDKPLSEQPAGKAILDFLVRRQATEVKKDKIAEHFARVNGLYHNSETFGSYLKGVADKLAKEKTGKDVWWMLAKHGSTERWARKHLKKSKIRGIQYEGASSGERNYVVFDPRDIVIHNVTTGTDAFKRAKELERLKRKSR